MDVYLFQKINQFALRWFWLDVLGIFFAKYFEYILIFCLLLFLVIKFRKYWKMVIQAIISALLARFFIVEIIRWLWQRPRPFIANNVNLLLDYPDKASFPSGHAAFFFALSTIIFLYLKKVYPRPRFWWGAGILFFVASFLICLARIFVGIHWPSDILAGAGIGILVGCLLYKISFRGRP